MLLEVPDTQGRYYTANFLDMYGNATNISARTHGMHGGRYLIVPASWQGMAPPDVTTFRVTTPYVWILLPILVTDESDRREVNALQDRFRLTLQHGTGSSEPPWPDGEAGSCRSEPPCRAAVIREGDA